MSLRGNGARPNFSSCLPALLQSSQHSLSLLFATKKIMAHSPGGTLTIYIDCGEYKEGD
jgi:hypothetical protein